MKPIAGCAGDLSAAWLSEALDTEVRSVSSEQIGTGQTSSTYLLHIDADGCAPTLVAKLAEGDEAARRQVATAHRNEVGFYTQLAATLDVRTPSCHYGAISDDGTQFTLLLEDQDIAGETPLPASSNNPALTKYAQQIIAGEKVIEPFTSPSNLPTKISKPEIPIVYTPAAEGGMYETYQPLNQPVETERLLTNTNPLLRELGLKPSYIETLQNMNALYIKSGDKYYTVYNGEPTGSGFVEKSLMNNHWPVPLKIKPGTLPTSVEEVYSGLYIGKKY